MSVRQQTAQAISQLIPSIVQGAHLGVFANRSMTQTQFLLLVSVHANGPCPMHKLAESMCVRMPTITGIVNRLVKAKYVKRIPNPHDRRQVVIDLTPKAHAFLRQFQSIIARRWEDVLTALDERQVKVLHNLIGILNESLKVKS